MAISLTEYGDYFKMLCKNHKSINHSDTDEHFYRMELEDILLETRGGVNPISCILESYDFGFYDATSDNVQKKRNGAFVIMGHVDDVNNYDEIASVRDECERIGCDFTKIMFQHKASKAVPVMRYFDMNTVEAQFVDVRAMNEFGIRFTFAVNSPEGNTVDADRWNDLNSIVIINDYGVVQLDGTLLKPEDRMKYKININGAEPYRHHTNSKQEPTGFQVTNKNRFVLDMPTQVDVRSFIENGYYIIEVTSNIGDINSAGLSYGY